MKFKEWINHFKEEDNVFGDLAKDINRDTNFPKTNKFEDIENHLTSLGAFKEAIEVFEEAWKQYEKSGVNQ